MHADGGAARRGAFPIDSLWISPFLAIAGALPWAFSFAEQALVALPWLALAPLVLLAERRRPWLWGWIHGFVFWLVSIPWIAPTIGNYGELGPWVGGLLFGVLAVYLGLFHAVFCWLAAIAWRRQGTWIVLFSLPALWVIVEAFRTVLVSGFPWNLAAYAWIEVPGALELSAWIGPYGVGYLVVLANTGLALTLSRLRWQQAVVGLAVPIAALALAARPATSVDAGPTRRIHLVQPNTPILRWDDTERIEHHYSRLLELTPEDCAGDLVIWPESAAFPFSIQRDPRLNVDTRLVTRPGCHLLLSSPRWEDDRVYNSAFLIDEVGRRDSYDKRHLVPYGEYAPLAEVMPFIGTLARNAGDFSASKELSLLPWQGERLGLSICYEVIFADEVAAVAREGATVLVSMTNDAWYGDSWAPWQHLRAARFRAAENRKPMVRAALTGVSAVIGPDGSLEQWLGVGDEGVLVAEVHPSTSTTPFARRPWLARGVCVLLGAFAIFRRPPLRRGR